MGRLTLPSIWACLAEIAGTFLLVLFGIGSVAAAVLTGAQVGLWQVAVVWGFGVALAIYATGTVSGAHLNPAVSLAFAIFRRRSFPPSHMLAYWLSQLVGAFLAGLVIFLTFSSFITRFERDHSLVRGEPGSQLSAMIFGEYFPNPAMFGTDSAAQALVSPLGAVLVEGLGTAILVFVIFALSDRRNAALTNKDFAPFMIGFTVAVLISVFSPLTQAGWNPARDFGPRLVAFMSGWGPIAIPGPSAGFWVYIVGPLAGAPLGAALYEFLIKPRLQTSVPSSIEEPKVQDLPHAADDD